MPQNNSCKDTCLPSNKRCSLMESYTWTHQCYLACIRQLCVDKGYHLEELLKAMTDRNGQRKREREREREWKKSILSACSHTKYSKKWYLMLPCLALSIIWYGLWVSGAIQGNELCSSLHFGVVAIEKGAFGSPSTMVG